MCNVHKNDQLDVEFLKANNVNIEEEEEDGIWRIDRHHENKLVLLICSICCISHRHEPFCVKGYEISSETGTEVSFLVHV
jgi:hypothetical protein